MRRRTFIIFIIPLIFLTGCWDKVEIDQRTFVSSIGVDLNEEAEGMNQYVVTYEYPNINAIGKNATEDTKTYVTSTSCSSIFQAGRELSTKEPFPFYYKHLKILVLGDELVHHEKLVRQIIDELNRDTKINKKLQVLVADGKAIDVIKANVTREQTTDGVLYSTVKDNKNSSRFTPKTLTGMISDFGFSGITITPRVSIKDNRYLVSGGCIMKNYSHLAWIDQKENRSINLMMGKVKSETVDVIYNDDLVSYTVTDGKSSKDVIIDKDITVNLSIRLEGYLQGYIMEENKTAYKNEILMEMEKAIENKITKEIEKTLKVLQQEYNADVIGIGEHISKFNPKEWHQMKESWEDIFPQVKFNVSVDTKIRRTGLTK